MPFPVWLETQTPSTWGTAGRQALRPPAWLTTQLSRTGQSWVSVGLKLVCVGSVSPHLEDEWWVVWLEAVSLFSLYFLSFKMYSLVISYTNTMFRSHPHPVCSPLQLLSAPHVNPLLALLFLLLFLLFILIIVIFTLLFPSSFLSTLSLIPLPNVSLLPDESSGNRVKKSWKCLETLDDSASTSQMCL